MDQGSGQGEVAQGTIPFGPVPASFSFQPAMIDGNPVVILNIKTPDSMSVTFWPPEMVEAMARNANQVAVQARSGLIIPGGNGQGDVVDLGSFRDAPDGNLDAETDQPEVPDGDEPMDECTCHGSYYAPEDSFDPSCPVHGHVDAPE